MTDAPAGRTTVRPPSVERVLAAARPRAGERDSYAVLAVARQVVDGERARLAAGEAPRDAAALGAQVVLTLEGFDGSAGAGAAGGSGGTGPTPVLNATGVIVHTNLGRAAWPRAAVEAARLAA